MKYAFYKAILLKFMTFAQAFVILSFQFYAKSQEYKL